MASLPTRNRVRLDLPEDFRRALRSRAEEEGVSPNEIIMGVLEPHLKVELIRVRKRMDLPEEGIRTTSLKRGRPAKPANG